MSVVSSAVSAALAGGEPVVLRDLWHRYPGAAAGAWTLRGLDLSLKAGELVGLLGPSGCGKTTLLRLIAGFERPVRGSVQIHGREVAGEQRWLPPERRGVGMVFQDYALFPHLDGWANVCFGLRPGEHRDRAAWLLELLGLSGLERRYPHELSGGQRQRLALARALAPGNAVLLLDEPFSNLDVEVRLRLRSELPAVLAECGASALLVTHDPEEAMAICDRVAVLRDGLLDQCSSPLELVQRPATAFVGRFVLQANLLPVQRQGDRLLSELGPFALESAGPLADPESSELQLLLSADGLELLPLAAGRCRVLGREFLGHGWLYRVACGASTLRLRLPLEQDHPPGLACELRVRPGQRALLYPGAHPVRMVASP
ncbi:MAG: ABC transporter ATP-binding protein [Cyanobacteria bacterium]|nr:ABC transporter ATP-binding protein [Cyanobacteriota bacterium]